MKEDHITCGRAFGFENFSFKSLWIDGVVWRQQRGIVRVDYRLHLSECLGEMGWVIVIEGRHYVKL
jgi:hypothetical protein